MIMNIINKYINKYKELSVQVKATLWFLVCSFMQKGISTITTPIFTRLMTTDEYGQYSVFNSWLGILQVVMTLNIASGAYTQGLVKFESQREEYASSMQGLLISLCTGWSIIYILFRDFWNRIFGLTTIQMLSLIHI